MEALMQKNILQSKRVGSDYLRYTIFYGIVGILFSAFGLSQLRSRHGGASAGNETDSFAVEANPVWHHGERP